MEKNKNQNILITPSYYTDFKCTASECSDNCCCGGWMIEIDDKTAGYYRKLDDDFGKKLQMALETDEDGSTYFKLENGQCPFLTDTRLCGICGKLGEKYMGVVCREFPRYTLNIGNISERGIGIACEEAARLVLYNEKPFELVERVTDYSPETVEDEQPDDEYVRELIHARKLIFECMRDESRSLSERIATVIDMASGWQNELDEDGTHFVSAFNSDNNCRRNSGDKVIKMPENAQQLGRQLLDIYAGLEILNDKWPRYVDTVQKIMHEEASLDSYCDSMTRLEDHIAGGSRVLTNFFNYMVFRYFMRAAYDYNLLDKVKFAACSYIVFRELLTALWIDNGADLTREAVIEAAKVFSRQVEYSDENVESICEEFLFGDDLASEYIIMNII